MGDDSEVSTHLAIRHLKLENTRMKILHGKKELNWDLGLVAGAVEIPFLLSPLFHCSNFCVECLSLGSVRNSVCLWPVIDNAVQAALALVSGA